MYHKFLLLLKCSFLSTKVLRSILIALCTTHQYFSLLHVRTHHILHFLSSSYEQPGYLQLIAHTAKTILNTLLHVHLLICMKTLYTYQVCQVIGMNFLNLTEECLLRLIDPLTSGSHQQCFYISISLLNFSIIQLSYFLSLQ